jgi:penicillin amidase
MVGSIRVYGLSACLAAVPAASGAGDLAAQARRSASRVEGKLPVAGLAAPVEVLRDRWGIPHIYARTLEDLFLAQGFVQAQDRLFQMELWRRSTQGRLAELLGPGLVERDRITRLVTRYRGDMEAEWASYDVDARRIVESFVRGINAYVDLRRGDPPLEFRLAGLDLEHWRPEDLLARAEAFVMSGNAASEVARARQVSRLGAERALALAPPDPPLPASALVPPGLDLEAVGPELAAALASIGSAPRFAPRETLAASGFDDYGSNNWVLAGRRTATGRPYLANDPHRNLDHPSLRYLVHLDGPGYKVAGAVVPWFPGVAIGHNEDVAWGLTIFAIDAQDLFVEETDPADPTRYRVGSDWEAMRVEREAVRVKGARPVEVELRFTRHGPVVHQDLARHRAFALRWTGSEPGTAGYLAGLALGRARSAAEFREALRRWRMPGENFVFADRSGAIGYQAAGLAPVRDRGHGLLPAPGASGDYDWRGFHPMEALPRAADPERGFLATANHRTLEPGHPVVGREWSNRFRIDRIEEVLGRDRPFTRQDMQELQQDVVATPARALVPLLLDLAPADPAVREARERLLAWDARMDASSGAAALFAAWHVELAGALTRRLSGSDGTGADAGLVRAVAAQVVVDALRAPGPARDALLVETLGRAAAAMRERLGGDAAAWRWGHLHRARFAHPLAVDAATRALFDRGPLARPGYGYTVNNTGGADFEQTAGATFREIVDVGAWDETLVSSAPGQSGEPGSPHFDDLLPIWAEGRYLPLAFSRRKVEELARHRLVLEPVRRRPSS